ncbi:hypothetical protein IWZ03DRAFT_135267 [Phyllosticta citriasiana]|uniref:Uncharacterized protein n=1 Tax=Phyllosticta citriasiana TaxID=595635 RepID=A0ABR1KS38_9PEZI
MSALFFFFFPFFFFSFSLVADFVLLLLCLFSYFYSILSLSIVAWIFCPVLCACFIWSSSTRMAISDRGYVGRKEGGAWLQPRVSSPVSSCLCRTSTSRLVACSKKYFSQAGEGGVQAQIGGPSNHATVFEVFCLGCIFHDTSMLPWCWRRRRRQPTGNRPPVLRPQILGAGSPFWLSRG